MMSEENLRKLIWDLHDLGVRGVEFCGGGEPTLHSALPTLIRDMKAKGMSTGLLTNGTKLTGELASAVVDCASYVRIGFDSGSAEMFNKVKRPKSPAASFDAVCENVANTISLRNERGGKVLISMKVILCSENYGEIEECVRLATDLGVDSIQFKAARLTDKELTPEQVAIVNETMDRVRSQYPTMTVVGGADKLSIDRQCWLTPIQIMVDTLGDVFLCCYYRHRRETHSFGNAFQQPLRDIWYSQRHWDAIASIQPAECNLLDCRFVQYNRVMTMLLLENDAQFEFI
jgi:MoaA/NifB/PqqE/SkfB family radical SAM enzyme